jgi:hypothetical protein
VAAGGYWCWVWFPIYSDHYTVKQVVNDFMNQAVKNPDDATLRQDMVKKLASLVRVQTVDDRGQRVTVPAIVVDERAVIWERDRDAKLLHVAFEYERQVEYPFLDRSAVKTFTVDRTGDLTVPDWGPQR